MLTVRIGQGEVDARIECECGWKIEGDSAVDAFRAFWKHRAERHPDD